MERNDRLYEYIPNNFGCHSEFAIFGKPSSASHLWQAIYDEPKIKSRNDVLNA